MAICRRFWIAELRSTIPAPGPHMSVINSVFCKMTRLNRIASSKQILDMVLLCLTSQFGFVFGWELSCLVWFVIFWFGVVEFGLVWLSLIWYG